MRRTVRLFSEQGPEQRVAAAIAGLPTTAQQALVDVALRPDLPLVAGSWNDGGSGCLVANVVALRDAAGQGGATADTTLDLRILDLFPELSSRDLNQLIVAWDTAAEQDGAVDDEALRRLLLGALRRAGALPHADAEPSGVGDAATPGRVGGPRARRGGDAPVEALATAGAAAAGRDAR